jgi:hypothetical protein
MIIRAVRNGSFVYCLIFMLQAVYFKTKHFEFIRNKIFLSIVSYIHMLLVIYMQFCFFSYSVIFYMFKIIFKVFITSLPIILMFLFNPLPTFIYTLIFTYINFDFSYWWNSSEPNFFGIETLMNYVTNAFFLLYNIFVSFSISIFILSIPFFIGFIIWYQPLKLESNISMLKREVLLSIVLMNCSLFYCCHGAPISLLYLLLVKIDHHSTSKIINRFFQSLNRWYVTSDIIFHLF